MTTEKKTRAPKKSIAWLKTAYTMAEKTKLSDHDYEQLDEIVTLCTKLIKLASPKLAEAHDKRDKELKAKIKENNSRLAFAEKVAGLGK